MKTVYESKINENGFEVVTMHRIPETPEDEAQLKREAEEAKLWCNCEKDYDTYYVPDGEDARCLKHHYRCGHCHKIVQIG